MPVRRLIGVLRDLQEGLDSDAAHHLSMVGKDLPLLQDTQQRLRELI